jgi:UDP-glucose 4-epimerase
MVLIVLGAVVNVVTVPVVGAAVAVADNVVMGQVALVVLTMIMIVEDAEEAVVVHAVMVRVALEAVAHVATVLTVLAGVGSAAMVQIVLETNSISLILKRNDRDRCRILLQ